MNKKSIFGINAVVSMLDYSRQRFIDNGKLDVRFFDCYLEHKRLMKIRVHMLSGIMKTHHLCSEYDGIFSQAQIIKNLSIKTNLTKEIKCFNDLERILLENLKNERKILREFINEVSEYD